MNIQVFETQIIKKSILQPLAARCTPTHIHVDQFLILLCLKGIHIQQVTCWGGGNSNWQAQPNNFYRVGKNPKKSYFLYVLGPFGPKQGGETGFRVGFSPVSPPLWPHLYSGFQSLAQRFCIPNRVGKQALGWDFPQSPHPYGHAWV